MLPPTPDVSDLEIESAILRGVASHRPIGRHKHVLILSLQADVHEQTHVWVPIDDLWMRLHELYNLEALDDMSSSTPSIPGSPNPLSPIPNPSRRRPSARPSTDADASGPLEAKAKATTPTPAGARSLSGSPLSSPSPSPTSKPPTKRSRSAAIIDSPHFERVFEIPLGTGLSRGKGRGSRSRRGSGVTIDEEETGYAVGEEAAEGGWAGEADEDGGDGGGADDEKDESGPSDAEQGVWGELVYPRATAPDEKDEGWDEAVRAQLEQAVRVDDIEEEEGGADTGAGGGGGSGKGGGRGRGARGSRGGRKSVGGTGRPRGRPPNAARRTSTASRRETSPLSISSVSEYKVSTTATAAPPEIKRPRGRPKRQIENVEESDDEKSNKRKRR